MKKKIKTAVSILLMTTVLTSNVMAAQEIAIKVNGSTVETEDPTVVVEGLKTAVSPLVAVAEKMGCKATPMNNEDGDLYGLFIESDNIKVFMEFGSSLLYVTNTKTNAETPPKAVYATGTTVLDGNNTIEASLQGDTPYLPIRAVVEALGGTVEWNAETRTIYITYDKSTSDSKSTATVGVIKAAENGTYVGELKDGVANGTGTMVWHDDNGNETDKYEGDWVEGKRTGEGTYTWSDGTVYTGEFSNNKMEGTGTMTWTNGDVYVGQWVKSQRTSGTYTWADGAKYVGRFSNSKKDGYGTLYDETGEVIYDGQWENDNFISGIGVKYYSSAVYVGDLDNGIPNGEGTMTWDDGTVYEGQWVDGDMCGQGKVVCSEENEDYSGMEFEGEFSDDCPDGEGTLKYPNGDVYVGEVVHFLKQGKGTMTYADGTVLEGFWEDDEYVDGSGEASEENEEASEDESEENSEDNV
ncbi:MAG: hypothetical protein LUC97_07595 [Clostridiales bacterium]|nr:hypothetical protein [Clostridiales bacterium]